MGGAGAIGARLKPFALILAFSSLVLSVVVPFFQVRGLSVSVWRLLYLDCCVSCLVSRLLLIVCRVLFVCWWLFVVSCLLLVVCGLLFFVCCSLFVVCCLSYVSCLVVVVCCLWFVVSRVSFVACRLPIAVCCTAQSLSDLIHSYPGSSSLGHHRLRINVDPGLTNLRLLIWGCSPPKVINLH